MKYVYGRKKWLAAGIAALLISGTGDGMTGRIRAPS